MAKKKYKGKFIKEFITQKQTYKPGDSYETESEKAYEYLLNLKIIEK